MSKQEKTTDSPAMQLLALTWEHTGGINSAGHSWRRLNASMQTALRLAIEGQFEFAEGDFRAIYERFNAGYWIGQNIETYYSLACDGPHGPNPTATKALEKTLGRKPFIVQRSAGDPRKLRLHVGSTFDWHEDMKKRVFVEVTSFRKPEDADPHVVACSYRREKDANGYEQRKVDKRYKITHADIAAYHKAIRDHAKQAEEARALEKAEARAD